MIVSLTLLLAIVTGGSSDASSAAFILFRLLCLFILGAALLRLIATRLAVTEKLAVLLIVGAVALVALQLVPLPYAVFATLPGRELVTKVFSIAGIPPRSMPTTLNSGETWACLLSLMPPIAVFIATVTTEIRMRWLLVAAVLFGSIANVFLGLAQRFQGSTSTLYLYEITNNGSATGFFSNRNNFAMLLCAAIPLTWAMTHKLIRMRVGPPPALLAGGGVMLLIILMGLAASDSRSGILLGMLALTLSTLMVVAAPQAKSRSDRRNKRAKYALLAVLGGAFVIGQFGMVGILRIIESDPLGDYRSTIRALTMRAASDYFPVGSGFGTFRDVYAMHETPSTMLSAFVNHAHNDWLELWLEGGVPATFLLVCAVALLTLQALRVWNPRGSFAEHVLPRAASIVVLVLLLHSTVEFPLRMPALACVFAAMTAILLAPAPRRHAKASPGQPTVHGDTDNFPDETRAVPPTRAARSVPPTFRVRHNDENASRKASRADRAREGQSET